MYFIVLTPERTKYVFSEKLLKHPGSD